MREYKFYIVGKDGHIVGPPQEHELEGDREAIKKARLVALDDDVEIWEGARLVAYVTPDKTA